MGAFNDFFQSIKGLLEGPVPYGGTIIPTSEEHPVALAQNIRGNSYTLPTLDVLANIPYRLLQFDMEVTVSEYAIDVDTLHPRTRYRLYNMPPAGVRVSEIPGYVVTDYWVGITGDIPEPGPPGANGLNGWTPVYSNEDDGPNRVVEKLIDWTGGTGTKPSANTNNHYVGNLGFTTKSLATNKKGSAGSNANVAPDYYLSIGPSLVANVLLTQTAGLVFINALQIINIWTVARYFKVRAVVRFFKSQGSSLILADLRVKSGIISGAPAIGTAWVPSFSYSLVDSDRDIINNGGDLTDASSGAKKVTLEHIVKLNPNEIVSFYLSVRSFNNDLNRSVGFIEVIGL